MKYTKDENDRYSITLDWIENGDEQTYLDESERLKSVLDGFLGYKLHNPALIFNLNPPPYHQIRLDDIQEGSSTFAVYWETGGGFTFFEIVDSSLDGEMWGTAGDPLELIT